MCFSSRHFSIIRLNRSKFLFFWGLALFLFLLFFPFAVFSQSSPSLPSFSWGTYWGGGEYYTESKQNADSRSPDKYKKRLERGVFSLTSSCTDGEGNLYVVGKQQASLFPQIRDNPLYRVPDTVTTDADAYIAKFSPEGVLLWSAYYGSSAHDEASVVKVSHKGDVYVAGRIYLSPQIWEYQDMNRMEIDPKTIVPWANDFPLQSKGGGPYKDTGGMFILKFSPEGERLWARLYGPGQDNVSRRSVLISPHHMEIDAFDNVYICGTMNSRSYNAKLFHYSKGASLPIFGPSGSFLYDGDTTPVLHERAREHPYFRQFLLKMDARDSLVWSTYFPAIDDISGMKVDSKENLYLYGLTNYADFPPPKAKEGAYFAKKDSTPYHVNVGEGYGMTFYWWPYLAKFDKRGEYEWCTYLGKGLASDAFTGDLLVTGEDHVILTGHIGTYTNDTLYPERYDFPIVEKAGAYNQKLCVTDTLLGIYRRTFFTEFDAGGKMIWSTSYPHTWSNFGARLQSDLKGGFYCLGATIKCQYKEDPDCYGYNFLMEDHDAFLCHFDHARKLVSEQDLPFKLPPYCWTNRVYGDGFNPYDVVSLAFFLNASIVHPTPSLGLSLSPKGKLYLTANTLQADRSLLRAFGPSSYFQSRPLREDAPLSGLILALDLCDTTAYRSIPLSHRDTFYCAHTPLDLSVSVPPPNRGFSEIIWNPGRADEYRGDTLHVSGQGSYYAEIRSVYRDCPSVYSDTLHIDTLPVPTLSFNFPDDTLFLCVGEQTHTLDAFSPGASYLWHDGSTSSSYTIRYRGDSLSKLWCEVRNACHAQSASDTLWVQYYPPYAYLGEDTLLCHRDSLFIDASFLNGELPQRLHYLWIFNGDTVQGSGNLGESYTIRYPDSGLLRIEVSWEDSVARCNVAQDSLYFHYYKGSDVAFQIQDTTICQGDEALLTIQDGEEGADVVYRWYSSWGDFLQTGCCLRTQDSGLYKIIGSNPCSMSAGEVYLGYYPSTWIALNYPLDTFVCPSEELCIDARVSIHRTVYQWADAPDLETGYRCVDRGGVYGLRLEDTVGCWAAYEIRVSEESCAPVLVIANVFTPNGDGINDVLRIRTAEQIRDLELTIFSSWGLQVYAYKGEAEDFRWEGQAKNSSQGLPDGSYFYVALFKDYQGKSRKQSGCIMILR